MRCRGLHQWLSTELSEWSYTNLIVLEMSTSGCFETVINTRVKE